MALYTPALVWEKAVDICKIPRTQDSEGFTNYIIEIKVSHYKWTVSRRYKQFVDLHEKLIKDFTINKSLLPPKKLFGNRSESFINERRKGLEFYLQSLIHQFNILPESLALFLDFQKYEVRTISSGLSETFYSKGEEILLKKIPHEFTPLHLHAITERLKLGEPTYSNDPKKDIAHLVEFITQLQHAIVVGNSTHFGSSNITPNQLSFDLSWFKNILTLEFINCNLESTLSSAEELRTKLKSLVIHKTLNDISSVLLCGIIHWCPITDPVHTWPFWSSLTSINFSNNKITKIHSSIKLLSSVKHIDLSYNEIQTIENMETLSELTVLNLSHNKIQDVDSLHTRLGNINSLNLSSNKIKSMQGFCKLFSISELYLENNLVSTIGEITYLSKLPCLEVLNFQNNPVTLTVDYRPQVLLLFGSLAPELVLDGLKATEKEIDTVSILQALKQARGETSPFPNHNLPEEEINSKSNNYTSPVSKYQEQNSPGVNTTKKIMNNFYQSSQFRQQIETLRKIGGTDWLRLLNEKHNVKVKTNMSMDVDIEVLINDTSLPKEGICNEEKTSHEVSSTLIETLTSSFEIFYPDWLLSLDVSSLQLDHQLSDLHLNEHERSKCVNLLDWQTIVKDAKLIWAVLIDHQENLMYEVPVCILITYCEIVLFHLKKLSKAISLKSPNLNLTPEFSYSKSVSLNSIISFCIGPCSAYVELKIKNEQNYENIILTMDADTIEAFIMELHSLYNMVPSYKMNPFAEKMLELETMTANFLQSEISVQKQILFGQRVCVSKALHKCQLGILHYVFITPSHIVLVEERLQFPVNVFLDAMAQPQFQICSLINVHTNIKQIHLKDIDNYSDIFNPLCSSNEEKLQHRQFLEKENNLDILYKLGSWLIIEFDSKLSLYLKFLNLKQRNQFLDIFLGVRNQR